MKSTLSILTSVLTVFAPHSIYKTIKKEYQ
jgi:hypothetical protein